MSEIWPCWGSPNPFLVILLENWIQNFRILLWKAPCNSPHPINRNYGIMNIPNYPACPFILINLRLAGSINWFKPSIRFSPPKFIKFHTLASIICKFSSNWKIDKILKQFNTPKTLYLYIFSKNGPLLTIFGLYIAHINIRSADQQLVKFCWVGGSKKKFKKRKLFI